MYNERVKRLEVKSLSFEYESKKEAVSVFDNLSLSVNEGEFVVILGSSGCGKSTLLKLVAGLLEPRRGEIWINGLNASLLHNKDRNIGYVSQSYTTYPFLSVYENIAFPLKAERIGLKEIEERVNAVAAYFAVAHLLSRRPRQLSEGQKQRVSLARAFVKHPTLYLLDEPFSGLDVKTREDLRSLLMHVHHDERGTFLMVSHDINDAVALGDRIMVLEGLSGLREISKDDLFAEKEAALRDSLMELGQ